MAGLAGKGLDGVIFPFCPDALGGTACETLSLRCLPPKENLTHPNPTYPPTPLATSS